MPCNSKYHKPNRNVIVIDKNNQTIKMFIAIIWVTIDSHVKCPNCDSPTCVCVCVRACTVPWRWQHSRARRWTGPLRPWPGGSWCTWAPPTSCTALAGSSAASTQHTVGLTDTMDCKKGLISRCINGPKHPYYVLRQCLSNGGTCTPRGTQRYHRGYLIIIIIIKLYLYSTFHTRNAAQSALHIAEND